MTRHELAYRRLLSVYPASYRDQYGEEMVTLYIDQLRLAQTGGGGIRTAGLWVRTLGDVLSTAPGQRLRKEELVPRPVDAAAGAQIGEPVRGGLGRMGYAIALLPLWCGIILQLAAPGFLDPLLEDRITFVGLPIGIAVTFVAGLLMAFGILAMRWARSNLGGMVAFLLLTIPSLILIVLAPAMILIVVNLRV